MFTTSSNNNKSLIFTYGTLKQGFPNHNLLQNMILAGEAAFLGAALTADRLPLVCGPYRVPFLINIPGAGERVIGEIYAVSRRALSCLDELEGISCGHYERRAVRVIMLAGGEEGVEAEAYFAHRDFGERMWRRNGEKGLCGYTAEEAVGYVSREDRPRDITFFEEIGIFLNSVVD